MKIENIMKMLEVFWPIAIAIYGFFIYKFIPYMKTKIFINEYHNFEVSFFFDGIRISRNYCSTGIGYIFNCSIWKIDVV